jgi:hypothetical protein
MRYARCRGLVGRQELWHENCCYGSGKEIDRLASGGKFEFGQVCFFFFLSKLDIGTAQGFFFFFFNFGVAIIHKHI